MYVESDMSRWFSDPLKDLLSKILVPDPSARIGLYNVISALTLSIPLFNHNESIGNGSRLHSILGILEMI